MYNLVFYFFYKYFVSKEDRSPKFGAICGVLLTIGLHIILAYVIVQKIVGHNLLQPLSQEYYWSKMLNMIVILPFFIMGVFFSIASELIISLLSMKIKMCSLSLIG